MPRYRDAAYGGESVALENSKVTLELHRRVTGWGWGELLVAMSDGEKRFFAVLEHLGELQIEGYPRPMRFEAEGYQKLATDSGMALSFDVKANAAPHGQDDPPITGKVRIELSKDEPRLQYHMEIVSKGEVFLRYLRGPWLKVGADSFGTRRRDAIFPGIEWLVGEEWSSGTDWFEHPEALRVTPHPYKVSIPIMAISEGGVGLGLSWNPEQSALSHVTRIRCPQPVFASPNFIDRRNNHLIGLMIPSARWGLKENSLAADPAVTIPPGLKLVVDAAISVIQGTSLDVILDWIKRNGLPDPGRPRYQWKEALEKIAKAYNTNLWTEGRGWGVAGKASTGIPRFFEYYLRHGEDEETVKGLSEKAEWCRVAEPRKVDVDTAWIWPLGLDEDSLLKVGQRLLQLQSPDGSFPFDPDGRHKAPLLERAALWRPLAGARDTALDLCATTAIFLLVAGEKLGEKSFLEGARRALDFCIDLERPEGGDWWETPLHSPNLLASGHAAIAYALGYRIFQDPRYIEKARYWIRCLIPFTHLWQPGDMEMVYNTKACFCSTSWFLSDWTSKHVQWEVLTVFSKSHALGIDWAKLDPEVDWERFHRGITTAALRWMIDHEDASWMYRYELPREKVEAGQWDTCFCDTFDPVWGTYGGAPIMPELIAENIVWILRRHGERANLS